MLVLVEYFAPLAARKSKPIPPRALNPSVGVVDTVGIGPHRVHRIKELGVLVVGDLVLADAVGVGHGAKSKVLWIT